MPTSHDTHALDLYRLRLRLRYRALASTRAFFVSREFIETDTPVARRYPCSEPFLDPVHAVFTDPQGCRRDVWLHCSPEYSMKRVLGLGFARIFQLAPVFRDGEGSPWHSAEFLMLEWYRTRATYVRIMDDTAALVHALWKDLCAAGIPGVPAMTCPPPARWQRIPFRDAVLAHAGIDLASCGDAGALAHALRGRGLTHIVQEGGDWHAMVMHLLVDQVEPRLGIAAPTFLVDYPPGFASLARVRGEGAGAVAERFELYIAGVELANGFTELTDPDEQEKRFRAEAAEYEARTGRRRPWDRDFLHTLRQGIPPCAGVALGFDRLLMLLLGARSIRDVRPPL